MKFTPKTPEQEKKENERFLCPKGVYDFEVREFVKDGVSDKGNPWEQYKIIVFGTEYEYHIYDIICPAYWKKFKHFFDSIGKLEWAEKGSYDPRDVVGKTGKCKIDHEDYNGESQNVISDYVKRDSEQSSPVPKPKSSDDEMPF
jgi:hypothetical protein